MGFEENMKMYCMRLFFFPEVGGGGGYSLLWPIQGCAAKQGMVIDLLVPQGIFFRLACKIDLIC